MGVNGVAAANRLRGFTNIDHGMCLFYVWQAYKAEGARVDGSYPTALAGWNGSPGKHEGDRNPPAGVPVWWGAKPGSSAGDVVISLGGGLVVATDYPRYGVVGVCTIDERERQIGRPYLGWTETILGAPIDFAGGGQPANVGGGQRTVGPNGARRRSAPSSQSAEAGDMLTPGTVGNFTGWTRGENVEGNDVWFQGTSGNWFWSGGFTEGANTSGLADLNAPTANTGAGQRIVGPNGARRRSAPSSQSAEAGDMLTPGTVGNFTGWARGENVEGNDVWFQGTSGNWFWSGGFVGGADTTGLADTNPPAPTTPPAAGNTRTVGTGGANGRTGPGRGYPVAQSLPAGTVGTVDGWTHGENVEGIDIWFRGALSGNWFWAGGFTSQATDGIPELADPAPTPTPTPTPDPPAGGATIDNPLGLETYTPFYPHAVIGLRAPLGNYPRGSKGKPAVPAEVVIDQFHIHRTGTDGDDGAWFSKLNDRGSCPHLHILQGGRIREFIRPKMKPALTGPDWNWRGYGIEIQGAGDGTAEQFEAVADVMAWLASHEGKLLDGVPVRYNLRTRANTTVTHREMIATECPGEWWQSRVDALIERARVILDTSYGGAPTTPTPTPDPGSDDLVVLPPVSRAKLEALRDYLNGALG